MQELKAYYIFIFLTANAFLKRAKTESQIGQKLQNATLARASIVKVFFGEAPPPPPTPTLTWHCGPRWWLRHQFWSLLFQEWSWLFQTLTKTLSIIIMTMMSTNSAIAFVILTKTLNFFNNNKKFEIPFSICSPNFSIHCTVPPVLKCPVTAPKCIFE